MGPRPRKIPLILLALVLATTMVLGSTAAPAGHKSAKIKVGNNFFSPTKKTVKRGTVVKFKWTGGGAPHNVTKKSGPAGKFKSKTTAAGGVHFKKKFKRAGTYKIFCTIHPNSMNLKLRVKR